MSNSPAPSDLAAFVECRLGNTIGRWLSFASACRPLGLVALSPDTRINGDWSCGYNLADSEIVGFSVAASTPEKIQPTRTDA